MQEISHGVIEDIERIADEITELATNNGINCINVLSVSGRPMFMASNYDCSGNVVILSSGAKIDGTWIEVAS